MKNKQADGSVSIAKVFGRYARDFFSPYLDSEERGFKPSVEVVETSSGYQISAELPGIEEEDIHITLQDNSILLEGRRKKGMKEEGEHYRSEFNYGDFYRAIPLKEDVDDNQVEATYKNGILSLSLVKRQDGIDKTQKIPIIKH